jgi:hypothetical protein
MGARKEPNVTLLPRRNRAWNLLCAAKISLEEFKAAGTRRAENLALPSFFHFPALARPPFTALIATL